MIARDEKRSGELGAVDEAVTLNMPGLGCAMVQLTGTFEATVTFEVSVTGGSGEYEAVYARKLDSGLLATTATATGIYQIHAPGARYVRVRCSAYTSGDVEVEINGSLAVLAAPTGPTAAPEEAEILASAARTATTTSEDFVNPGYRGAWFYLNVTANPGGAETLTLAIQAKCGTRDAYKTITAYPTAVTAANVLQPHLIYPAALHTSALTTSHVWGTQLPPNYRVIVTHSSTGSWTYSLDVQLIP